MSSCYFHQLPLGKPKFTETCGQLSSNRMLQKLSGPIRNVHSN
uniref:Uncharacterized protein n=1 Tax=Anguilla anguilla TaxID=7936 RepID=A0A0E9VPM7_ANGAN